MEEAFDWVSDNQGTVALTWVAVVFATAVLWFTTKEIPKLLSTLKCHFPSSVNLIGKERFCRSLD
ncbi:unnamed protein product [Aureobasidium pullulans]|nr:unnamed protein product [Aureobasidium pullulans]